MRPSTTSNSCRARRRPPHRRSGSRCFTPRSTARRMRRKQTAIRSIPTKRSASPTGPVSPAKPSSSAANRRRAASRPEAAGKRRTASSNSRMPTGAAHSRSRCRNCRSWSSRSISAAPRCRRATATGASTSREKTAIRSSSIPGRPAAGTCCTDGKEKESGILTCNPFRSRPARPIPRGTGSRSGSMARSSCSG